MNVVVIPGGALSGNDFKETAERVLRLFGRKGDQIAPGGRIEVGEKQYTLDLAGRGTKSFTVGVPKPGRYAIFTQHTPEEFTLRVEDARGKHLEPVAAKAYAAGHTHDDTVTSVGIETEGTVDKNKFNAWLSKLLREQGVDIFRSKGILNIKGDDKRFVFQGVHMLLDGDSDRPWGKGRRVNQLCFIGRKLDREALISGFRACLA